MMDRLRIGEGQGGRPSARVRQHGQPMESTASGQENPSDFGGLGFDHGRLLPCSDHAALRSAK